MQFEEADGYAVCHLTPAEAEAGMVATMQLAAPVPCGICQGSGKKGLFKCRACHGSGRGVWRIPIRVSIPKGVRTEDKLEYFVEAPEARHLVPAEYSIRAAVAEGAQCTNAFAGLGFADLGDVFGSFFGADGPFNGDNGDLQQQLSLSAPEAQTGGNRELRYPVTPACQFCGGTGEAVRGTSPQCPSCAGSGKVRRQQHTPFGTVQTAQPCKRCKGRGLLIQNPCSVCGGSGAVEVTESVNVFLPPGTADGYSVTIPDKGRYRKDGGRGRLTVTVKVNR